MIDRRIKFQIDFLFFRPKQKFQRQQKYTYTSLANTSKLSSETDQSYSTYRCFTWVEGRCKSQWLSGYQVGMQPGHIFEKCSISYNSNTYSIYIQGRVQKLHTNIESQLLNLKLYLLKFFNLSTGQRMKQKSTSELLKINRRSFSSEALLLLYCVEPRSNEATLILLQLHLMLVFIISFNLAFLAWCCSSSA